MALARYVAAGCIGAQRWIAPALAYVVALAVSYSAGGSALVNLSLGAIWLFPIAAWVTLATLNDEDDDHMAITATAVGGTGRLRATKVLVGVSAALVLAGLAVVFAFVRGTFTPEALAAGVLAYLATVAGGATVGMLLARPLVVRTGWALLAICLLTIADLAIPNAPPVRLTLTALVDDGHPDWPALLVCAGTMLATTPLALSLTSRLARSRDPRR